MNESQKNNTVEEKNNQNKPVNKKNDTGARILCLVGAMLIWFYAVSSQTIIEDTRFASIPVKLMSVDTLEEEYGMTVISGYDYNVDVTLSGTRSELSRIDADDISAYVDLSQIETAGTYSLDLRVSAPGGVSVKELSANYVDVYVDKRSSKNVEIRINPIYMIESNYLLGTPKADIETVTVTGPADVLSQITHAQVTVDVGKLTKTVTTTGSIVLYAGGTPVTNPYVKTTQSDVTVVVPVYTEKEVDLAVEFKHGYFNEKNSKITIEPSSIRIKGDPTELDKINTLHIMTIDEKSISATTTSRTAIIELPDGIESVYGVDSATVTINQIGVSTREINVKNITVKNPEGLNYSIARDSVNVMLRGGSGSLALVSESNISLEADLSYYAKASGRVSVPVKIILPNSLSSSVYEIGEYTLEFDIK
ncbi:MAG: hypothetical protein E7635_05010 [Ruminococcaceae bacterium]|nr:hypothetical protein [Oscillospiraceae bacterium]